MSLHGIITDESDTEKSLRSLSQVEEVTKESVMK